MKAIIRGVIIALLMAVALQGKEVVKIGVILPLPGNNSYLGENARDGILLRLKELPKDSRFEYKVIFEDNEFSPAKTNLAARKLKSLDKVDAIFSLWGYAYNIVLPAIKGSSIIHLSLDAWSEPSGYPYDFVLCATYEDYAKKMAEAAVAMGAHSAAYFGVASTDEKRYCQTLKKELGARGIKLLDEHYTDFDTRDFRTYLLKVRELNPDIFIATTIQPMMEIVLRQMRDIGYHPMLAAGSSNFLDVSEKKLVDGGVYVLTPPNPKWFKEKYLAVYHKEPAYPAANGYDTLLVLINSCEKLPAGKKPTAAGISSEIKKIKDFPGALGPTSFVPPNKLPSPVVCYFIRNGKAEVVSLEELKQLKGKK